MKRKLTVPPLMPDGEFALGCNYWASNSGVRMWEEWSPDVIARDLDHLKKLKMDWLRVFPLWSVFQPITRHKTFANTTAEIRLEGKLLPSEGVGRMGLSEAALDKFEVFADLAHKRGFKLMVSLVTGWMSGGMFAPPALDGLNLITDPEAVLWETRFVSGFVSHFRSHKAIAAWELGNECNALAIVDRSQSALWMASISNAIRGADPLRPVFSGMHALTGESGGNWHLADQGEFLDMMTPHPYPMFSPFAGLDALNTPRGVLQAAAANRFSEDLSGKPSFVEEFGTLGPCLGSPQVAAEHVRGVLFTLWAQNGRGLFWWCNHDFSHREDPPYSWFALERELGLFDAEGKPRPFATEIRKFASFLEKLPIKSLPKRITDAACLLTREQEQWPVANSTFILGQQAGIDFSFHNLLEQPVPEAAVYFLPSMKSAWSIERGQWRDLCSRVRKGATLYISIDDAMLDEFEAVTGLRIETRQRRTSDLRVEFEGEKMDFSMSGQMGHTFSVVGKKLEVLACEDGGSPLFTRYNLGKGQVFVLGFPVERHLASLPGAFHGETDKQAQLFYRKLASFLKPSDVGRKVAAQEYPHVAMTEHILNNNQRVVVVINLKSSPSPVSIKLSPPWRIYNTWHGPAAIQNHQENCWSISLAGMETAVYEITRRRTRFSR